MSAEQPNGSVSGRHGGAVESPDDIALGSHLLRIVDWWMVAMEENSQVLGIPTLTRSQAMMAAHISLGEHRPTRLAEKLGVTRQAVHFLTNQLVELGVIVVRQDPSDRRANIVEIAPQHADSAASYPRLMAALEGKLAERLGADFDAFQRIAKQDWGEIPILSKSDLDVDE